MFSSLSSFQSFIQNKLEQVVITTREILSNQFGLPIPDIYIPFRSDAYENWATGTPNTTNITSTNNPTIVSNGFSSNSQYLRCVKASNQRLNLPNYSMSTVTSFSVSMWVNFGSGNSNYANVWCITNYYRPGGADSTNKYTWAIFYLPSSSQIRFEYARDVSVGTVRRGYTHQSTVSINQWYHIVAIQKTDNSMELWVNNVKQTATTLTGTNPTTVPTYNWTSTFHALARSSYGGDSATEVGIDDFRFYTNNVLTSNQIQTLYDARNQANDFIN